MELKDISDVDLVGYSEDTVDQFITLNDSDIDKSINSMPECMRSMFFELTFIGAAYSNPKIVKRFEPFIKPQYDFTTEANRFFYYNLIDIGNFNDWNISEYTICGYMADNSERAKKFQKFGEYNWIKFAMKMAEENDAAKSIETYYNVLKNYSLIREYWRKGLKNIAEKMARWKKFQTLKPREILITMNQTINKVYTSLANIEDQKDLTENLVGLMHEKLKYPEQGLPYAFPIMTQVFNGIRLGQFVAWGMLSNAGKSRFLMREIANLSFVHNQKVLLISNEMTEEEMKHCLVVTIVNNLDLQALHGIEIQQGFRQNSFSNGLYKVDEEFKDEKGVVDGVVVHLRDEDGNDLETDEEYIERLRKISTEFNNVEKILDWVEKKMKQHIYILETGSDYSDNDLKQIIENTCLSEDIHYVFYDTFKSDKDAMGDWAAMKKTATILSELAKKKNIYIGANIQLTDDAALLQPLELTSNNIANSKQIKHVLDSLCLFREIVVSDYNKYFYWKSVEDYNSATMDYYELNPEKRYYVCRIDKNRAGTKPDLLFSLNLDTNVWEECGRVGKTSNYTLTRLVKEKNGKRIDIQEKMDGSKVTETTDSKGRKTINTVSNWDAGF